jgi:hypothetical protein
VSAPADSDRVLMQSNPTPQEINIGHPRRRSLTPPQAHQHAAAAKVLSALLDKLRLASAQGRRGRLAVVRTLTERGGA